MSKYDYRRIFRLLLSHHNVTHCLFLEQDMVPQGGGGGGGCGKLAWLSRRGERGGGGATA